MAKAKSGSWWDSNPQRALSRNNSAVYERKPSVGLIFERVGTPVRLQIRRTRIFPWRTHKTPLPRQGEETARKSLGGEPLRRSAVARKICNLSEVVVEASDSLDDLKDKVRIATIIGTIQSAWTNFKYLRAAWRTNCEDEPYISECPHVPVHHPCIVRVMKH